MRDEFDFIASIGRRAERQRHRRALLKGIGDDAAIYKERVGYETVITTDLLVEAIDFHLDWTPPRLLGHKALAVSLSDIAAMGARPVFALLSFGVPRHIWHTDFMDKFYEGFFALADEHHVNLIGGDVSRTSERVVIDSIVIGEAKQNRAVLRSGARPGDAIFVTGTLGGAAAGLKLLEAGARLSDEKRDERNTPARKHVTPQSARDKLLLRHLCPQPRLQWGALLSETGLATAMIDLSDGLSSDLMHLCGARRGARLEAARIPLDPSMEISRMARREALTLALHGGEDFELLFTVRKRYRRRVPRQVGGIPATFIGEMTNEAGVGMLAEGTRSRVLKARGFRHFTNSHKRD
jgi:thiamine-monophosphate kinase